MKKKITNGTFVECIVSECRKQITFITRTGKRFTSNNVTELYELWLS